MNEHLKAHMNLAFMRFVKVYVYHTNTKKPWDKLTEKERNAKDFKWLCQKWFCVSKNELKAKDIKKHFDICPELKEPEGSVNEKHVDLYKGWKQHSEYYKIYPEYPLTEYDLKLLLNVVGIRMIHFVNN